MRRSAFVEWQDPPPKKRTDGSRHDREFDTPLLIMDLMREPGRWALTAFRHASNGSQTIRWCESRGMEVEVAHRAGQVYVRLLP